MTIPTQVSDVLILRTRESYTVHVVGRVTRLGRQDFSGQTDPRYEHDFVASVALAKTVAPGSRIY
jgi:hypothetical protein